MAHLIAGFPTVDESIEIGRSLVAGGAGYLELQFPYSDPTADGPTIETACGRALEAGFRVDRGFEIVRKLSIENRRRVPLFVMSYAGLVFARGVERFVREAKACGAAGVIVPDLMPDYDEGLFACGAGVGLHVVPVIAPSIGSDRLDRILAFKSPFLYAAVRTGITGVRTVIDNRVRRFLERIRRPGTKIIAGFGISDYGQARELRKYADVLVVGSAFVRTVLDAVSSGLDIQEAVRYKALDISGRLTGGASEKEKAAYRRRNTQSGR